MSDIILKWSLVPFGEQVFVFPEGHQVIACTTQSGAPTLWTVGPDVPPSVRRQFRAVFTGEPFDRGVDDHYLGTCVGLQGRTASGSYGGLVAHVFEVPCPPFPEPCRQCGTYHARVDLSPALPTNGA